MALPKSTQRIHHPNTGESLTAAAAGHKSRRRLTALVEPLIDLTQDSSHLFYASLEPFEFGNEFYRIPRFVFIGPGSGSAYQRLGLFAGIHGDESAGPEAVAALLTLLVQNPNLAKGWEIFAYPVCNPTGYEDNTRYCRRGHDLNRSFWSKSRLPEIQILEDQLSGLSFNGIISLHADDTSDGIYGFARGSEITREVLEPALKAAAEILPVNSQKQIDGFPADGGIIHECYEGILSAPPGRSGRPFEIILESPQTAPLESQVEAHLRAVETILALFPQFIAYGLNL